MSLGRLLSVERKEDMDSWVLAAAAAGYLAMCWHNLTKVGDILKDSSPETLGFIKPRSMQLIHHIHGTSCWFHQSGWSKMKCIETSIKDEKISDEKASEASWFFCASKGKVACSGGSDGGDFLSFEINDDSNEHSFSSVLQESSRSENCVQEIENGVGDFHVESSVATAVTFRSSLMNKGSIRGIRSNVLSGQPLSSLESCLLSQLYTEYDKMRECFISSLASRSEPFFIGDETYQGYRLEEICEEQCDNYFGFPLLPRVMRMELQRKIKSNAGEIQSGRLSIPSKLIDGRCSYFQGDQKLLLSLGIFVGLLSSVIANKLEVEKLRGLLKETENLVQDLQEEIELYNAISLKELVNEGDSFHNMELNAGSPARDLKILAAYDTIEAELEAELERLEPSIETKGMPDLVESGPEFEADNSSGSDQCTSDTSTAQSANYAVSPRDLSLRLHKVIHSRLDERVRELEMALENSERKVRELEAKQMHSSKVAEEQGSENQECLGEFDGSLLEFKSNDYRMSSDESDDETEELLIRQIVERTKQGSPALLNAQRALLLMVENEEPGNEAHGLFCF